MITTLAPPGYRPLREEPRQVTLVEHLAETRIEGQGLLTTPSWHWGPR